MAILFNSLPEKIQESIQNLHTLSEIGTGSDTQDEFVLDGIIAIRFLLSNATLDSENAG